MVIEKKGEGITDDGWTIDGSGHESGELLERDKSFLQYPLIGFNTTGTKTLSPV